LKSPSVRDEILKALSTSADDVIVEIGAGTGTLTTGLAGRAARVLAVEVDPELVPVLEQAVRSMANVSVLCRNILAVDLRRVAAEYNRERLVLVGNLPYHLTTQVVLYLVKHRSAISEAVIMLQKEYAQRLLAAPGGRDYGAITLRVAYNALVTKVADVPSSAFYPRPKVDSMVVKLAFRESPAVLVADEGFFFGVIRETFNHRRKMLVNSLSALSGFNKDEVKEICLSVGIGPDQRPETLSLEEFARLADAVRSASLARSGGERPVGSA
jgi:16S rRNA (adenine1518-N6/adenine1519-N6)-dimethyltransferase